ncbi:hypothetical protein EIN_523300 [Entamoeba invadens IP1]|uniref:Leucine rich repeat containing protein BspA family protein n=1 Tax=Entamoeba invadens IP1 TaxID=370355 RepID=A0A0A1UB74_ENTIV|nr:hypothetical protein EIN_523300 [Entamoeba invadens IP1]ELP92452.1 hypothetical protein EIN_523300 [Entamoeba invadens IP1]|eukprot:XP_004259223.1 hypothetical protein EIN_523300 [Entamoeba invadens IP1]
MCIDESVFVHNTLTKITFCGKKCIPCKTCSYCQNMQEVVMDNTVEIIAKSAFSNCISLKKITLSSNLEIICKRAFFNCQKLENFEVPQKVRCVGSFAFENCVQLKELVFRKTVVFGMGGCFERCVSLTHLNVPNDFMKHLYNATESEQEIFKRLKIEVLNRMNNKEINNRVFKYDNYSKITDNVTINSDSMHLADLDTFNTNAKYTSEYLRVYIPSTVVDANFGLHDFGNFIEKFVITENVLLMTESEFYINNAKYVQLPDTITVIPKYCFSNSVLREFVVPQSVREIGKNAFLNSKNLTSLYIPKSVTKIGNNFVRGCTNLKYVVFENGRHFDIKEETESLNITHNVTLNTTKLNYNVEYYLGSTKIEVPSSVTKISSFYFKNNKYLREIVLPTTIKIFGDSIFDKCHKLTKITFSACNNTLNNSENYIEKINTFKTFFFNTLVVSYEFYLQMKAFGFTFHNVNLTYKDMEEFCDKVDTSVIKSINYEDKNTLIKNFGDWKPQSHLNDTFIEKLVIP